MKKGLDSALVYSGLFNSKGEGGCWFHIFLSFANWTAWFERQAIPHAWSGLNWTSDAGHLLHIQLYLLSCAPLLHISALARTAACAHRPSANRAFALALRRTRESCTFPSHCWSIARVEIHSCASSCWGKRIANVLSRTACCGKLCCQCLLSICTFVLLHWYCSSLHTWLLQGYIVSG